MLHHSSLMSPLPKCCCHAATAHICNVLVGSIIPRAMPCWPQSAAIRLTAGTSKKEFLGQQIFLSFLGKRAIRSPQQRCVELYSAGENRHQHQRDLYWNDLSCIDQIQFGNGAPVFSTVRLYRQTIHDQFYVSQRVEVGDKDKPRIKGNANIPERESLQLAPQ